MMVAFTFLIMIGLCSRAFAQLTKEDPLEDEPATQDSMPMLPTSVVEETEPIPKALADAMDEFQSTAGLAQKQIRDGVLPKEETEKLYLKMTETLDDIINFVRTPNNAYSFLKEEGFDRIIFSSLSINYSKLRSRVLLLTKALFDIAPTTTKTVIPIRVIDKLLDIFEQDDNLAIKAYAMEILSVWLPDNPQAQARLMKMKGLEPFYRQISKLDSSVISMILKLFTDIINEHMLVRNKKPQKSKADYVTLKLYQQIGLIERLATPEVCKGLLNIFEEIWTYNTEGKDALPPVLELLQIIKPHCLRVYKGKSQAIALVGQLLKFVQSPSNTEYFVRVKVNATAMSEFLEDFAEKLKIPPRVEL